MQNYFVKLKVWSKSIPIQSQKTNFILLLVTSDLHCMTFNQGRSGKGLEKVRKGLRMKFLSHLRQHNFITF